MTSQVDSDLAQTTDPVEATESEVEQFKSRSVSGAISYTLRSLFLFSVGFGTSLALAAYLSAEDFGIYGFVTQMVGLLQFFSSIGLGPALIQMKREPTTEEYRAVFTVQQILSWFIVCLAVGISLSGVFTAKIGYSGVLVLLALAISFPLDSLRVIPAIIIERKLDFSRLVIPNIFEQIVYNVVLLVAVIIFKQGVLSYAYAILLRGVVGVCVMYLLQSWSFGLSFDKKIIQSFLSTGAKFQLSDFLARIKDQLFYIFLGAFLPLKEFGYITWAKSWSQMPYNLTVQNVIAITFPAYSRLQHDKRLLKRAIEKTMYFISVSIFPVLTTMAVFITPLTQTISRYQKWQPALLTFILFSLSIGWAAISSPLTNTLNAIGEVNQTLKLMVMWTVLTWILTPLCMAMWGFQGVAIAAFLISFTSILPVIFVRKYVDVDIFSQVKDPLFASFIMGVFALITRNLATSLVNIFALMVGCTGVYICTLLMLGRQRLFLEVKSLRSK